MQRMSKMNPATIVPVVLPREIVAPYTVDEFRAFVSRLLCLSGVPEALRAALVSDENLAAFKQAFTHKSASDKLNYEVFETIGDVTLNKCVMWYFWRVIKNVTPEMLTLLKIKFASTKMMSIFAKDMDFDKYVLMHPDLYKHKFKILEDVLEAFIGCLEHLIDGIHELHGGYQYAYNFVVYYIEKYMRGVDIEALTENDLLDPISRLKNVADRHKTAIEYVHDTVNIHSAHHIRTRVIWNGTITLAACTARSKKQSKQMAAEAALAEIGRQGRGGGAAGARSPSPL
jgi:dsRNA-specific ribonuclease